MAMPSQSAGRGSHDLAQFPLVLDFMGLQEGKHRDTKGTEEAKGVEYKCGLGVSLATGSKS
jgi:hypothetical protein